MKTKSHAYQTSSNKINAVYYSFIEAILETEWGYRNNVTDHNIIATYSNGP